MLLGERHEVLAGRCYGRDFAKYRASQNIYTYATARRLGQVACATSGAPISCDHHDHVVWVVGAAEGDGYTTVIRGDALGG